MSRLQDTVMRLKTMNFFLLNYKVVGATEKWWARLHSWGGCDGQVLALQVRLAGKMRGQGPCCLMKEQPRYKEVFIEMDDGLVESLWVKGEACKEDIMMRGCCRHPIRVSKWMKPSLKH